MTPIGSTSSNIRRAIEFMVDLSFYKLGAPGGRSRSIGRPQTAKLIAPRSRIAAWRTAQKVAALHGSDEVDERVERADGVAREAPSVTQSSDLGDDLFDGTDEA